RFRFRGRNAAFVVVIAAMMLPPQVTMVPLYIVWARFGLTGTLWPLIIPQLFGDAFSIFLLRQFLVTIPREYADAA
ncbi:carbohydrate ABC transporter permease, partial [Micromonospora aurantiaca]|nr:carbohydrate ABC transporter permease [Micromonospora aurantiaca]